MECGPQIAVAGNQWITEFLVTHLARGGYTPTLLINVARENSKNISGYVDLQEVANREKCEIYRPSLYSLRSETDERALSARDIDVLFVFGWQRLIPKWLIDRCRLGVYGVHGGPQKPPRARGRAVMNWALLLGYSRFYMYLFRITPEVDAGGILDLVEFDITSHDDVVSLYHKNCVVSTRMFLKHLPSILDGTVALVENPDEGATYLPKRTPDNSGIWWDAGAERITNLIRAVTDPYPAAYTYLAGMKVEILEGHTFDRTIPYQGQLGEVLDVFPNEHFIVMTSDYPLYVRRYRCDDRSRIMPGQVFQARSGEHLQDPRI